MHEKHEIELFETVEYHIRKLLNRFSIEIDDDSRKQVIHYLDHDEYEMAFEILFLEVMEHNIKLNKKEYSLYIDLGRKMKIEEEHCIIDALFWEKFSCYKNVE